MAKFSTDVVTSQTTPGNDRPSEFFGKIVSQIAQLISIDDLNYLTRLKLLPISIDPRRAFTHPTLCLGIGVL